MKTKSLGLIALLAACSHNPAPATAPVPLPTTSTAPATTPEPAPVPAKRHDESLPQPRIARPTAAVTTRAPADATVLFDGTSLESWRAADGSAARWRLVDGALEVVAGTGAIHTAASYGDVQLHIEWATPLPPEGEGENRGNSGVQFMGKYEVQILDSYGNTTIADTHAGAVYGQSPPLVNASLPPGEWQSFDIVFHAPRFDNGKLVTPARVTVFQNGVLVQDNVVIRGVTSNEDAGSTQAHAERLPLYLENGGQPVHFRNIWIRDLGSGE